MFERIPYKNFKNDKPYFYAHDKSYNYDNHTILVDYRYIIEFDYKIIENYKPIHLRYIIYRKDEYLMLAASYKNENGNIEVFSRISKYDNSIKILDEYLLDYFETVKLNEKEKREVIKNLKRDINSINYTYNIKKLIEDGLVTNYTKVKLDNNISVSQGELDNPKNEEPKKIIKMRYADFKETDFESVQNSYDRNNKTIDVYVPENYEYELPIFKVITMRYADYKKTNFKQVKDSYSKRYKTIDVYVPETYKYKLEL